jgi:hypothetical protein
MVRVSTTQLGEKNTSKSWWTGAWWCLFCLIIIYTHTRNAGISCHTHAAKNKSIYAAGSSCPFLSLVVGLPSTEHIKMSEVCLDVKSSTRTQFKSVQTVRTNYGFGGFESPKYYRGMFVSMYETLMKY